MSVNDLRKYNNQYNEQELPGPDVQQLPGGGGATHILLVFVQCVLLGLSYLTLCPVILFTFCS